MSEPGAADGLDPEIRDRVIAMMGQAKSEAWKVFSSAPHALELDELVSLAYAGLAAAGARWRTYCESNGYDPAATNYFSAYALRRIRGSMLDALRSKDWVTRSMRTRAKQIAEADQGRGLPEEQLAELTGLSVKQVRETMAGVAGRPVSFDAETHDVADDGDTESQAVVSSVLDLVQEAIDGLDPAAQVILALRYHQGLELSEIAGQLELPPERVTGLHDAAVKAVHAVMLRAMTLTGVPGA